MSDISDVTALVRHLVEDSSRAQSPGDVHSYGSSAIFPLSEPNVISITSVLKNNATLTIDQYSYNSSTNQVTVTASLSSGDTVEIRYTYYANYSDAEIESYIRAASVHISINNYMTWEIDTSDNFYPDISDAERNLVAIIASILMKPDNISYRLPDFSISVPQSMPTRDLISQAIRKFKSNTHGNFEIIGTNSPI